MPDRWILGSDRRKSRLLLPLFIVAASIGIAVAAGGSLKSLELVRMQWWGLAPIGLAMQLAPFPSSHSELGQRIAALVLFASFPVLLAFVGRNIRVSGLWMIFLGLLLNFAVIVANGSMPVSGTAIRSAGGTSGLDSLVADPDPKHHLMTTEDVLTPLADVLVIPSPVREIFSLGDVLIYAGLAWFLIATMQEPIAVTASPARPRNRRPGYRGKHRVHRRRLPGAPLLLQPAAGGRSGTAP
jgi:Family of unknown function (DUF5317)